MRLGFVVHDHDGRPRPAPRVQGEQGGARSGPRARRRAPDRGDQVEHAREPLGGTLAQPLPQRLRDVRRDVRSELAQLRRSVSRRSRAAQALVGERRQRVLVGPSRRPARIERLGGRPGADHDLRDGEVPDQRPLVRVQHDVAGRQRAMDHTAPVRVVQRAGHLLERAQAVGQIHRSAGADDLRDGATFDVLGGEPEEARRGAAAVGRDDVRMIERRGCLGGAPEPIFRSRVSERLARSDLHLHLPILTRVVGEVDSGRGLVLCRQQRLDAEFARQLATGVELRQGGSRGGRGGRGRRRLGSDTGHLVAAHGAPRRTVRNVEERAARTLHQKTPILIAPLIASPSPATYTPAARSLRRCSWLI